MRITIRADEGDRSLVVASREIRTGRDAGEAVTIEPGAEYSAEVNDDYHLVIMPGAPADGSQTLTEVGIAPVAPVEEAPETRDATDAELLEVYDAGVVDGKFNVGPLNEALAAKGFNPVSGERRDTVVKNRAPA